MTNKSPKEIAKYHPSIYDYSSYSLVDVTDELIKLINNNVYLFPDESMRIYSALLNRYNELLELINKYTY